MLKVRNVRTKKITSAISENAAVSSGVSLAGSSYLSPGVSPQSSIGARSYSSSLTTSSVSSLPSVNSKSSVITELFAKRVRSGIVSESTKRSKPENRDNPPVIVWSINITGKRCGTALDGFYPASDFLVTNNGFSDNDLLLLVPESEDVLQRVQAPAGLLKANEACNILNGRPKEQAETSDARQELAHLQKFAPYVVSQTGKAPGSSSIRKIS